MIEKGYDYHDQYLIDATTLISLHEEMPDHPALQACPG